MNYLTNYLLLFTSAALVSGATSAISLSHESAIKYLDDQFLVTCKDQSGRPVTWTGPRGPLGSKTHPRVETASYGTSLLFAKVTLKESGNYTCNAGQDHNRFHLTVKAPLTFMDTSPVQTGREHTDVTLRCEVKGGDAGGDKPIVSWSMENGKLNPPKFQIIGDGLLIKNVSREDDKTYICKAMQTSTGDIREQKIKLKVEHKPVLKHPVWAKEEEAWGFIGGEVNLTCEVDAEPAPSFEWYRKKRITHDGQIHNETHKSVLQVYIKDAAMFGNYMCKATNKVGTLEKIFVLQQGVQALPPDFIELRGANSDLLDIGIHGTDTTEKLPASMLTVGYRVQYKARHTKHWKHTDFQTSEDRSYPIQELTHDTEYEVRAATRNKAGISVYTNTSLFKTLTSQADGDLHIKPSCLLLLILPMTLYITSLLIS